MMNIDDKILTALTNTVRSVKFFVSHNGKDMFPTNLELEFKSYNSEKDTFIGSFIAKQGSLTCQAPFNLEDEWIEIFGGVKIDGDFVFENLGQYCIFQKSKNTYQFADKRILFEIENDLRFDELTLQELYESVIEKMIMCYPEHFKVEDFGPLPINANQIVLGSGVENVATYANIIELIAQCCASFAFITADGKLEFRLFQETGFAIEPKNLLNEYPSSCKEYGPINSVSFSRSGVDDFYILNDEESIELNGLNEIVFEDHPIMDANRESYASAIFERLNGLSYIPTTVQTQGFWFLEPGDIVNVRMKDGNIEKLHVMNHRLNFSGGCSSTFETIAPSATQIECRPPQKNDTKRIEKLERETTAKGIITKITSALENGSEEFETTEFKIDKDGFHIKNGGFDITNKNGVVVLFADEEGNLILRKIDAESGKIGLWKINGEGLYSDDTEMRQGIVAHSLLTPYNFKAEIENTETTFKDYALINPEYIGLMHQNNKGYYHFAIEWDKVSGWWKIGDANHVIEVLGSLLFANQVEFKSWMRVKGMLYASQIDVSEKIELGNSTMSMANTHIFDLNVSSGEFENSLQLLQNLSNDESILRPKHSNKMALGQSSRKFTTVYAENTAIQSDRKLKDNISDISQAHNFIMGLKPASYQMKGGKRTHLGFIAQEVAELNQNLGLDLSLVKASHVTYDEKGNPIDNHYDGSADVPDEELSWTLDYNEFVAPLVAVVQQQQKEIEELKKIIKKG